MQAVKVYFKLQALVFLTTSCLNFDLSVNPQQLDQAQAGQTSDDGDPGGVGSGDPTRGGGGGNSMPPGADSPAIPPTDPAVPSQPPSVPPPPPPPPPPVSDIDEPDPRPLREFYVSNSGNNSNPGTLTQPFGTLGYAISRLTPGDKLWVRGGAYFESVNIRVTSPDPLRPIVIENYNNETVVVDSGFQSFRQPGRNEWTLVNDATGEWESSASTFTKSGYMFGYVTNLVGYENQRLTLVPYKTLADFRSTTETYVNNSTPYYIGPGFFFDNGKIRIRLKKNEHVRNAERFLGFNYFPTDLPNPNDYTFVFSSAGSTLAINGSNITVRGLTINQATRSVSIGSNVNGIKLDRITVWMGYHGIAAEGSGVRNLKIINSRLFGDNPYYVYWFDMKEGRVVADDLRNSSIQLSGGIEDVEIAYCHFRGTGQDHIASVGTSVNRLVVHHNLFDSPGDDHLELEGSVGTVHIYENHFRNGFLVLAPGQDSPGFTGPVYFYRNLATQLQNPPVSGTPGAISWNGGKRFGHEYGFKHGSSASYNSKNIHIYHNTLVMLGSAGQGWNLTPRDPAGTFIGNNILVMVNGVVMGTYRSGAGQTIDGNLYWRVNAISGQPLVSGHNTIASLNQSTGFELRGIGSTSGAGTNPIFSKFTFNFLNTSQLSQALARYLETDRFPQFKWIDPVFDNPVRSDFVTSLGAPGCGRAIPVPSSLPDVRPQADIGAFPCGTSPTSLGGFPFENE